MQQFGIRSILSVLLVGLIVLTSPVSPRPMLVAYYTDWSLYRSCYNNLYKFTPEKMTSIISSIDVINYAFAKIDGTGHISMFDGKDCVLGKWDGCKAASKSVALIDRILKLKSINPTLQVLLSIGGWTWNGVNTCPIFSQMASTAASRQKFINEGIQISRTLGLSGIDIAWDYPAWTPRGCKSYDTENFRLLLSEFRAAIDAEVRAPGVNKLLLTIAAPDTTVALGLDIGNVHQYVDWINLMTFDYNEGSLYTYPNAPLYTYKYDRKGSVTSTVQYYLLQGVPSAKLMLGLPTYGRGYTITGMCGFTILPISGHSPPQPCTNEAGMYAYYELLSLMRNMSRAYNQATETLYACNEDMDTWLTYDEPGTIFEKARAAVDKGLGGAMVWTIDMDDFLSGYPLITAARNSLDGIYPARHGCQANITLHQIDGVNPWWFGFTVLHSSQPVAMVRLMDEVSLVEKNPQWMTMTRSDWGPWIIEMTSRELVPPLSVRLITSPNYGFPTQFSSSKAFEAIEPETDLDTGGCFADYKNFMHSSWCGGLVRSITLTLGDDSSEWWFSLYVDNQYTARQVSIRDSSPNAPWLRLTLADWATERGPWIFSDQPEPLQLPLSVNILAYSGARAVIPDAITSFTPNVPIYTGYCFPPVY